MSNEGNIGNNVNRINMSRDTYDIDHAWPPHFQVASYGPVCVCVCMCVCVACVDV